MIFYSLRLFFSDGCPGLFERKGDNCYLIASQGTMTFSAATDHCKSLDAYLAEPRTEEEHAILLYFTRNIGYYFWLGATDSDKEGTWVWQSDDEVLSYVNIRPGEINREDRDCLYMDTYDGFWDYFNCKNAFHVVCQQEFEGNIYKYIYISITANFFF